ncbi:MAG: rhomboid family intramembrane serine protease [Salinivirgaceae bacterium]|nr:rhomboid family intramembrane serine protease [Salinivirgaceae bacterium]
MNDFLAQFKQSNTLNKLIYINLAVFVIVKVADIVIMMFGVQEPNPVVGFLAAYSDLHDLLRHPWGVVTYMFLHQGFLHILFNLLWLFWFGRIFSEYFTGRQLLNVYICGGLAGALLYILSFNIFPVFDGVHSMAIGASAAVYAIVLATAVYVPNYTVYVMFLGQVKIKWIAVFCIISDLAMLESGNAGGHIAHIGGAIFGACYTLALRRGTDISGWVGRITDGFTGLFKRKPKMKVSYKRAESDYDYNARKHNEQKEIDAILDKIAKSGYNGLSEDEKRTLFRNSRNN